MALLLRSKCVVVGDAGCGKSSLCQAFHTDGSASTKNYSMTCGVDLLVKTVTIPDTPDTVEIYIHDSAGKEIFYEQVRSFWTQPSMIAVVYDVTSELSFSSCEKWFERVKSQKPDVPTPGALIANKVDLAERRAISPKAGKDLADKLGLEYFECSANEGTQVDVPFLYLASEFHKLYREKADIIAAIA